MKTNFIKFIFVAILSLNCGYSQWTQVGSGPVYSSGSVNSDLGNVGNVPYVAFITGASNYKVSVFNLVGSTWTPVGTADFSPDSCNFPNMATNNGLPTVAFLKFSGTYPGIPGLQVMNFTGSSWDYLGSAFVDSVAVSAPSLQFDGTVPYVAYRESNDMINIGASVKTFNGTSWSYVGTSIIKNSSSPTDPCLAINNSEVYVAFDDDSAGSASVKKWNGSQWVYIGAPGFSQPLQEIKMVFNNDTAYVAVNEAVGPDYKITVYKFTGTAWVQLGSPNFTPGYALGPSIVFVDNIPLVSFCDFNDSLRISVMKYEYGSWSYLDNAGDIGLGFPNMELINNQPYVAMDDYLLPESRVYTYQGAVSVEDLMNDDQITVFPNPTTHYITIDGTDKLEGIEEISLITLSGQVVYSQKGSFQNLTTIDCSSFQPGIYFIRLAVGNSIVSKRVIIQ